MFALCLQLGGKSVEIQLVKSQVIPANFFKDLIIDLPDDLKIVLQRAAGLIAGKFEGFDP